MLNMVSEERAVEMLFFGDDIRERDR